MSEEGFHTNVSEAGDILETAYVKEDRQPEQPQRILPAKPDAAVEAEPYRVEAEKAGCEHCGAGGMWGVCFTPEDCFESTFFENKETAQEVADMLNSAYLKGVAAVDKAR